LYAASSQRSWGRNTQLKALCVRQVRDLRFERLPASYAKIFDRPSHAHEEGVIVQYQASRRYRHDVS